MTMDESLSTSRGVMDLGLCRCMPHVCGGGGGGVRRSLVFPSERCHRVLFRSCDGGGLVSLSLLAGNGVC